ncbi:hypothetical protein [Pedobacter sp. Leaf176]|uniref:hypothetical protein n=1 Tax=Pedobacter sp. Leaf176 TaxID=1736286 RepID=UPI000701C232|nr:hypothetical protein [Pedobacter sp. Leaf176]KQR67740.1 hypothetical protein ASF92_18895 [Pedobacter sp. Leaf176]
MKTTLITLLIAVSSVLNAQEPVKKTATFIKPKNLVATSVTHNKTFAKDNFKLVGVPTRFKNSYQVSNILVGFEDYESLAGVTLEHVMEGELGHPESDLLKKIEVKGKIKKYKYQQFFVKTANRGNENYFYFISESKDKHGVRGCIAFKQQDAAQANQILNDLLNSIKLN